MSTYTPYAILKDHFEGLLNAYKNGSYIDYGYTYEDLRDTYEQMFDMKINRVEIFRTPLKISSLPIGAIATLVEPENYNKDLETGLMPTEKCVVSTNSINEEILTAIANKRPTESDIREYALFVYDSIKRVVEWDVFYTNNDYKARSNPYALTVKVIPLYFAVRHVMDWCYAESVRDAAKKAFRDIIERDISPLEECVDEILFNIIDRPYTQSIYEIYKIVTVKGECGLFLLRNVL